MIITAGKLITLAMDTIGALNLDETPTPAELSNGLTRLNMMLDAWSIDNLMLMGAIMESFALTAGKGAYTIGIGGDFNTAVPSAISDAFIRDGANQDTPLDIITQDAYNAIADKNASQGRPERLYYDKGPTQQTAPLGLLWFYPVPDTSYTLFMGQQKALTELTTVNDTVSFQTAYYEALLYNLALRLYRSFFKHGRSIPGDIIGLAKESKETIERMNYVKVRITSDFPGERGGYDITTDR